MGFPRQPVVIFGRRGRDLDAMVVDDLPFVLMAEVHSSQAELAFGSDRHAVMRLSQTASAHFPMDKGPLPWFLPSGQRRPPSDQAVAISCVLRICLRGLASRGASAWEFPACLRILRMDFDHLRWMRRTIYQCVNPIFPPPDFAVTA